MSILINFIKIYINMSFRIASYSIRNWNIYDLIDFDYKKYKMLLLVFTNIQFWLIPILS